MTNKEIIDTTIKLRQQVIDGGELFFSGEKLGLDIVNNFDDFIVLVNNVRNCRTPILVEKITRVPLTKEDLNSRFDSGKTLIS